MIQVTATMRILVAIEPVDLRKGIDGLAQFCREKLTADPFSGCLFIFRSRRGTTIKALAFDSCEVPDYVEWRVPQLGPWRFGLPRLST